MHAVARVAAAACAWSAVSAEESSGILRARRADSALLESQVSHGTPASPYGSVVLEQLTASSERIPLPWLMYESERFVQHHHGLAAQPSLRMVVGGGGTAGSSGATDDGGAPAPTCGDLFYSETRVGRTTLSFQVTVPGTTSPSAGQDGDLRVTEPETVQPLFGRLCWMHVVGEHALPAVDVQGCARRSGPQAHPPVEGAGGAAPPLVVTVTHHLLLSVSSPHGDVSVYSYSYGCGVNGTEQCTGSAPTGVPATEGVAVDVAGETSPAAASSPSPSPKLRLLSFNTWNVNPPTWLWREPRDRLRQYAFRMFAVGDVFGEADADVIALQEVRFDSTLGGWDGTTSTPAWKTMGPFSHEDSGGTAQQATVPAGCPACVCSCPGAEGGPAAVEAVLPSPSPPSSPAALGHPGFTPPTATPSALQEALSAYSAGEDDRVYSVLTKPARGQPFDFHFGHNVAQFWYNWTLTHTANAKFTEKGRGKWEGIASAEGWPTYGARHHTEGRVCGAPVTRPPAPAVEGEEAPLTPPAVDALTFTGCSPYIAEGLHTRLEPDRVRVQRALRRHPHAQVMHVASLLPRGWHFAAQPASLYLDRDTWVKGGRQRDEEGPAIFSRWPILATHALLLSRNTSDEGDNHQRLCLHAAIRAPRSALKAGVLAGDATTSGSVILDVYTVHLSLSEAARNRSVSEIRAFIRDTAHAQGSAVVLTGDMNGEPHEPALQALVGTLEEELVGDRLGLPIEGGGVSVAGGAPWSGPLLRDAWLEAGYPEPPPKSPDAAVRRYGLTFPSDNPVKRIDMVYVGAGRDWAGAVRATSAWLVGQDALPGTDAYEGRGGGRVSEQSPIWASDHRALAVELEL